MRDGRLLAESPPNDLITSYRMNVSTCDFHVNLVMFNVHCIFKLMRLIIADELGLGGYKCDTALVA